MPSETKRKFRIYVQRKYKGDWSLGFGLTHDSVFNEIYVYINLIILSAQIGWMG